MTDITKRNEIKGWIQSVLDLAGYRLDIIEHNKGINMSYNFIHDRIGVDIARIQKARKELSSPVSLKTYIEVMTLHELGHATDREALLDSLPWTIEAYNMKKAVPEDSHYSDVNLLKIILDEQLMNIEFEKTAWNHAETMNQRLRITNAETFEFIRQHSLASYEIPYLENLRLYERLLVDAAEMTA